MFSSHTPVNCLLPTLETTGKIADDIMEIEASFLAQQLQNFASVSLKTCFPVLLFFLTLSADKTTVQTVCFYENKERLLASYFSFETFSNPLEIGHAFREAYVKESKFFCRQEVRLSKKTQSHITTQMPTKPLSSVLLSHSLFGRKSLRKFSVFLWYCINDHIFHIFINICPRQSKNKGYLVRVGKGLFLDSVSQPFFLSEVHAEKHLSGYSRELKGSIPTTSAKILD